MQITVYMYMYAAQFTIVMIQHDMMSTSPFCGKLHTRDELNHYEQTWHSQIFLPQWNSLKMDVCTCSYRIAGNFGKVFNLANW